MMKWIEENVESYSEALESNQDLRLQMTSFRGDEAEPQ